MLFLIFDALFHLIDDGFECLRVVHGQIGQYFSVQVDIGFLQIAHKL